MDVNCEVVSTIVDSEVEIGVIVVVAFVTDVVTLSFWFYNIRSCTRENFLKY